MIDHMKNIASAKFPLVGKTSFKKVIIGLNTYIKTPNITMDVTK